MLVRQNTPETRKWFTLRSDWCVQLGPQVAEPVREFHMARGTYAFRGVIVYLMLSLRCACASREPGVIVSCCACAVSYTHLRAHETGRNLVCRLLLEKKKKNK